MQAGGTHRKRQKEPMPPCYGKPGKWGRSTCYRCRKIGGCYWHVKQGIKPEPIKPRTQWQDLLPKWESREAAEALTAPMREGEKKTILESDFLYMFHTLLTTTAEEQEAIVEKVKTGATAGDPEAETMAAVIKGHENVFFPLLDEITARKYRCRLKAWTRNREKKRTEAAAYLDACDRLGVELEPERRAILERGRGTITSGELLNVLERENEAAAGEMPK